MVANSIQNLPAFVASGQHSIVTAPADIDPSPRLRNLILRGSGSTSLLPAPVVALSCSGSSTLIIAFPLTGAQIWRTTVRLYCLVFGLLQSWWFSRFNKRASFVVPCAA